MACRADSFADRGVALVVAMMALLMISALGAALVLTTSTETMIAASFRMAAENLYAAEAALDRAARELALTEAWNRVLDGTERSPYSDGAPGGTRTLPDGTVVSLDEVLSLANCGQLSPCTPAQMDAVTADRPLGPNNPRWQLYAYGPITQVVPGGSFDPGVYIVVLVGDDELETDANPVVDGGPPVAPATDNPGWGAVTLRAIAFGPGGARQTVQSTVARALRTVSWVALP